MSRFESPRVRRRTAHLLSLACSTLVLSCGGGSENPTDPDPPTISISISPSSGTVEQGGSLTVTGTATIGGGFTGTVTFAVTGLPAAVTITVGTVQTSGSTTTAPITVAVGVSVAPGVYSGSVTASGSGVSANTAFSLTVTAAPGFSLGDISNVSIQQGSSGTREVDIVRTGGFADNVNIAVEGAPAGLTATPSPTPTTGTSSTITLDAAQSLATGTYSLTVRGTALGQPDATTGFDVMITAPPAGTLITVDFSVCPTDERPIWAAVKDGAAAWMPLTGVNDVYTLTVSQSVVGVTVVLADLTDTDVSVDFFTQSELIAAAAEPCDGVAGKSITGTATGTVGTSNLALGGASTIAFSDGIFGLLGVPDGAQDFVGYSNNLGAGSDRMLILRDQDIIDGGDIGTIDFATNGFDPASAAITVGGLIGGETGIVGMDYATSSAGSVCAVAPLHSAFLNTPFTGMSAPASEQAADEYHVASINTVFGLRTKQVKEAFQTLGSRTVAMPSNMPFPTVTDVSGSANYLRLQADYALPAEFNTMTFFDYAFGSWNMTVFATNAAMSGNVSLAMPDFTGLAGWNDAWGIPVASTGVDHVVWGGGETGATALCTEGGRMINSTLSGLFN